MKTTLFTILVAILTATYVQAQTVLGPGDMAVTELKHTSTLDNPSDRQEASFVLLKDCVAGTKFVVTDREFINGSIRVNNSNTGTPDEATVEITFGAAAPCGTQFTLSTQRRLNQSALVSVSGGGSPSITGGTNPGSFTLSSSGDGVIVFQDNNPNTANPARFITAANNSGEPFNGNTNITGASDLPTGLTVGVNAIALPFDNTESDTEFDNVYYNCSLTNGTPAQISGAVNNVSNWTLTNTQGNVFNTCAFVCQAACTDPVLNALNANPAASCPGTPVTLSVNGTLNDASRWELRTGSCTGPIVQTTTSNTFPNQVNPSETTTYFVTVANCNNQSVCQQGTVNRTVVGANAGADIRTSATSATLSGNTPVGSSTGLWTVVSGDGNGSIATPASPNSGFSGTAGQSYVLRWTISGGGCPASTDEVEVSFFAPTTLAVGDVAFTGYNIVQAISYSFVFLREVNAGTTLNITDKGWLGSAFRNGENVAAFTTDRSYPCGSEIIVLQDFQGGDYRTVDGAGRDAGAFVSTTGPFPGFSRLNDQLFAFQGSIGNPTFLAGIDVTADGWDDFPADDAASSALPAILASNNAAVEISGEPDAGKYNCSVVNTNPNLLRQAINTPGNWTTNNTGVDLTAFCNFNCAACNDPVLTGVSASPASSCPGEEVTLTINGNLMSATAWRLHEGSVNNPVLEMTTTNTFTVNPNATTTYVVSVVNCDNSPLSAMTTVNRSATAANITLEKPVAKRSGNSAVLTAIPPTGGQTATWTLVSGTDGNGSVSGNTLSGTAGQAYGVRLTLSGGSCPTTTDETTVSFLTNVTMTLGDMMFTGYNAQTNQEFSLVVLADGLPAGQIFSVTDNGWFDSGGLGSTENTASYILCLPLTCGDEVIFTPDGNGTLADGTVVATLNSGNYPSLGNVGDQLFVYDGTAAPTGADQSAFVAAIQLNCENGNCSAANWDGDRFDNNSSAKPSVFNGSNAFLYTGETNPRPHAKFNCTTVVGNGKTSALAALSNPSNWDFRENPAYDLTATCGTFSCCTPGTIANLTSNTNNVCPGTSVTISFDGTLNDSDEWLVSSGSCDGTFVVTLGGNGALSFNVNPTTTTTYYIRAEGLGANGCAAGECAAITVNVSNTVNAVCKPTHTVEIGADGNAIFEPADLDNGSSNTCNNQLTFSVDPSETFACSNIIDVPRTVTLTVSDASGASATCTSSVEVEDNIAPTFDCTDITVAFDANGEYFISDSDVYNRMIQNWNDNCASAPTSFGSGARTITCVNIANGTFSYFFGAFDGNGQEATCTSVITVSNAATACDDEAPNIVCQDFTDEIPVNQTYTLDLNDLDGGTTDASAFTLGMVRDTVGQISNSGSNIQEANVGNSFVAPITGFITTLVLKANLPSATTIRFFDGPTPFFATQIYEQGGVSLSNSSAPTVVTLTTPVPVVAGQSYSFRSDVRGLYFSNFDGTAYPDGSMVVGDGEIPALGDLDFNLYFAPTPNGLLFTANDIGTYEIGLTATDVLGLSDTCQVFFTLEGDLPPTAVCNATAVVEIDASGNAVFTPALLDGGSFDDRTATASLTLTSDRTAASFDCSSIVDPPVTVTLTVTDGSGQSSSCTTQVEVEDNVAPTADCNNIAVNLPGDGSDLLLFANGTEIATIAGNYQDNCGGGFTSVGANIGRFTCGDLGDVVTGNFGFQDGNGQQALCNGVLIQVNDPAGACSGAVNAACQSASGNLDPNGTFTLNANDLDNGSTADRGVYSMVFDDATASTGNDNAPFQFLDNQIGQSFTAPMDGAIRSISLLSSDARDNLTLYLYNGGSGSANENSVGTPDYTQTGVSLYTGVNGAYTEILLDTPFPVISGQQYSFVFEETINVWISNTGSAYTQGATLVNYGFPVDADLAFEVDFIGNTTMDFTSTGVFSTLVYAVDNVGTVSAACESIVSVSPCAVGEVTSVTADNTDICPGDNVQISWAGMLNGSAEWTVYTGACGGTFLTTTLGNSIVESPTVTTTYFVRAEGGCAAATCDGFSVTVTVDETPPTVVTRNISRDLDENGELTITPEEVLDADNSSDNCPPAGRSVMNDVIPVSVVPNMFTAADIGPNTVTLTARDANGNNATQTAVVTVTEAVFPVSWLYFGANAGAKTVDLEWATSAETNNAGFHVERSADGTDWAVLTEQAPLPGNAYRYTDEAPLPGDNLYRIRQTDLDGTVSYSPIEAVTFLGETAGLIVRPNPATDAFTVHIPARFGDNAHLQLSSITGRAVRTAPQATTAGMRFNTSRLARGVYLLRAVSVDGKETATVRVVVQ